MSYYMKFTSKHIIQTIKQQSKSGVFHESTLMGLKSLLGDNIVIQKVSQAIKGTNTKGLTIEYIYQLFDKQTKKSIHIGVLVGCEDEHKESTAYLLDIYEVDCKWEFNTVYRRVFEQ